MLDKLSHPRAPTSEFLKTKCHFKFHKALPCDSQLKKSFSKMKKASLSRCRHSFTHQTSPCRTHSV